MNSPGEFHPRALAEPYKNLSAQRSSDRNIYDPGQLIFGVMVKVLYYLDDSTPEVSPFCILPRQILTTPILGASLQVVIIC